MYLRCRKKGIVMELRDLRFFCKAAELGSVTKAAAELGVSQPFVTKVISQLEREIGTQLFDIKSRRIALNQYGEEFYRSARDIIDRADALLDSMDEMQGRSENTIRFLFNNAGYLESIADAYHKLHPECTISMTFAMRDAIIEALNTNTADFALTLPPIATEESKMIESVDLINDTGSVLLPPDSPLLEKDHLDLSDIESLSFIITPKGCGIRDEAERLFEQTHISPKIVYETTDSSLQISLVRKGMGAAFFSVAHTNDPVIGQWCRPIKIDQVFGRVGLSYNKYRHMSPIMEDFLKFMIDFFEKMRNTYTDGQQS